MKGGIYFSEKLFLLYKEEMRAVSREIKEHDWLSDYETTRGKKETFHHPANFQKIVEKVYVLGGEDPDFIEKIPAQYTSLRRLSQAITDWRIMRSRTGYTKIPNVQIQLTHAFPLGDMSKRSMSSVQGIGVSHKLPDLFLKWLLGLTYAQFENAGEAKGFDFKSTIVPVTDQVPLEDAVVDKNTGSTVENVIEQNPKSEPPRWGSPQYAMGGAAVLIVLVLVYVFRPPAGNTTIIHGDNNGSVMQESPVSGSDSSKDQLEGPQSPVEKPRDTVVAPPPKDPVMKSVALRTGDQPGLQLEEKGSAEKASVNPTAEKPRKTSPPNQSQPVQEDLLAKVSFAVSDENGYPMAGSTVSIPGVASGKTDANGNASLEFPGSMIDRSVSVKVLSPNGGSHTENFTLANNHSYDIRFF